LLGICKGVLLTDGSKKKEQEKDDFNDLMNTIVQRKVCIYFQAIEKKYCEHVDM